MAQEENILHKILVVDDDPDILDALSMILESKGYQVATAQDGIEGLASLVTHFPARRQRGYFIQVAVIQAEKYFSPF